MEEERSNEKTTESVIINGREEEEIVYKTKVIQFLGRKTPIILQNDNGPCPLLAICNILLLRNSLNLGVDAPEVSLQKLLALVAEKLIDSNSNIQNKDDEYVSNQQQNIADAIDLLPRLATGIDVNVQFRKINDFEFTRECAIFDLFDIGLYHGWIVDPQDTETAEAIGSKSYNTLVGELVAFEASKSCMHDSKIVEEEDTVDFVAATTAALGVPSPSLSRNISFEQKGSEKCYNIDPTEELIRALDLSKIDTSISSDVNSSHVLGADNSDVNHHKSSRAQNGVVEYNECQHSDLTMPPEVENSSIDIKDDALTSNISLANDDVMISSNSIVANQKDLTVPEVSSINSEDDGLTSKAFLSENDISLSSTANIARERDLIDFEDFTISNNATEELSNSQSCSENMFAYQITNINADNPVHYDESEVCTSQPAVPNENNHPLDGRRELLGVSEAGSSCFDNNEPIYEGEECVLDFGVQKYEDREPVYEGEMILAQQGEKIEEDAACVSSTVKNGSQQCQLIRNFLEMSASQLTIYGLFCLQEGLKERELCVFFRNNHFNTMFKFNGELYLLATDQGYINQPDLVWEKLNEVNGDTVFMTGNFTEFKVDNQVSESWNEQNAMTSTADFLANFEASAAANSSANSDLQLAIALQQQEFEQQPQQQQRQQQQRQQRQQPQQHSAASGHSRLVTGPQVSRTSQHASQKNETKKEKCSIM